MKGSDRHLIRIWLPRVLQTGTVFALVLILLRIIPTAPVSALGLTDWESSRGKAQQEEPTKEQAKKTDEGRKYSNEDLKEVAKSGGDSQKGHYTNKDLQESQNGNKNSENGQYTNESLKQYETGEATPQSEEGQSPGDVNQIDEPEAMGPVQTEEDAESSAASDMQTEAGEDDPWSTIGVYTDDLGRGETYWRRTMSEAREERASAREARDKLLNQIEAQRGMANAWQGDPAVMGHFNYLIEELAGHLETAEQRFAAAEQRITDLEEEARRNRALPGWLR